MSNEASQVTTQDRSPNYPRISIENAIERVRAAHQKTGKSALVMEAMAGALGFKNVSAGGTQIVLSALLQYGLLSKGGDKKISVSALAVRILHPTSEDQKLTAIREAALLPPVFADIRKNYHECSQDVLTSHLVQNRFSTDGAKKASAIYKQNSSFAKLDLAVYNEPETPKEQNQSEKPKDFSLDGGPKPLKDAHERAFGELDKLKGKTVLAQYSIPIGASEATITFTGEKLAVEDFDALADYVAIFKKQFERKQAAEKQAAAEAVEAL